MAENSLISSSIIPINPDTLEAQTFSPIDGAIIPNFEINSTFNPTSSIIEFYIYDLNGNLLSSDYNFRNWATYNDPALPSTGELLTLELDPSEDCINRGFDYGEVNTVYNFITNKLDSSQNVPYFISKISSDRTELELSNNYLNNEDIVTTFEEFYFTTTGKSRVFDEFYLNFGENKYYIGINSQLYSGSIDESDYKVLIKLYEPLPTQYDIKSEVWVCTKVGESVGYRVIFYDEIEEIDTLQYIKGPNTNLNIKNQVNNSTEYKTQDELLNTPLTSSLYQLQSLLNTSGSSINVDYTDYSDFIYLSSAKQRLSNFNYKVGLIGLYQNDIDTLTTITGPTNTTSQYSESISTLSQKIQNIITNFDGYDYYLYYSSESKAWPKSNSSPPYTLYPTGSTQVLNWLGSDEVSTPFYGGQMYTASYYDLENQNGLIYGVPEFIREDSSNENYDLFINMIGQHFDNLWLYTDNITTKLDKDNRIDYGVSKDLVADVLSSLGTKLYGGNFSVENMYSSFLGLTPSGSLLPFPFSTGSLPTPTGFEYINNFITASGDPMPLENAHKELYKRIYNNLPYLLKKKGTIEGVRSLITIYGIPDTILRISEFGGKDKDNFDDYDYWYDRYDYAFKTQNSASVIVPWAPLNNPLDSGSSGHDTPDGYSLPNSIQFRFKTHGIPESNRYSQSIFVQKNPTNRGYRNRF